MSELPDARVYAIQGEHGGPVKVGYCASEAGVRKRLADLQVGSPFPLVVRRTWPAPNGREDEQAIHEELAEYRLSGEWFMDCPTVAMRTGARLPQKGDEGRRYEGLVRSAYAAGKVAGAREAEKGAREGWRNWLDATLVWVNDEEIDPECSESAAEHSARIACKEAGVPYPERSGAHDPHMPGEEAA